MREAREPVATLRVGWLLFQAHVRIDRRRRILGLFWLVVPPLALGGVALFVRERGYVAAAAPPYGYTAFLLTGLFGWQIFTDALDAPIRTLTRYQHQIRSTLVRHGPLMIAALLQTLLNSVVRVTMLLAALALLLPFQLQTLMALAGMLPLALLGFALGLWLAPHALAHEEIRAILPYGLTFMMFLVPVFYPIDAGQLTAMIPLVTALETFRAVSLGLAPPGGGLIVLAISAVLAWSGWRVYQIWRPHMTARLG